MKIKIKKYAQAFCEATENLSGDKLTDAVKNFVAILASAGILSKQKQIIAGIETELNRRGGVLVVKVKTAAAMSAHEKTELAKKLKIAFGSEIKLVEKIDEQILGGLVLEAGDYLIDGSAKQQLTALKRRLIA